MSQLMSTGLFWVILRYAWMLPGQTLGPLHSLDSSLSHIHCESPDPCRDLLVTIEQDSFTLSQVGEGFQARGPCGTYGNGAVMPK